MLETSTLGSNPFLSPNSVHTPGTDSIYFIFLVIAVKQRGISLKQVVLVYTERLSFSCSKYALGISSRFPAAA